MTIPDLEFRTSQEIKIFQEEEMKKTLEYMKDKSGFYNQLFRKHKIDISRDPAAGRPCADPANNKGGSSAAWTGFYLC